MTFNKSWILTILLFSTLAIGATSALRILQADKIKRGAGLHTVPNSGTSNLVGDNLSQTLTNKTMDADDNTISDIDNNEIKAAAGIAYSKLNLTTSIVDGDVNASAAIARSKLASGSNDHVLINNGSGVMSSEAQLAVSRGGTGASTLTLNNVILGNGTSAVQFVAPGTSGNVLTSNGTTWTSSPPGGDATLWARLDLTGASCTITTQGGTATASSPSRTAAGRCQITLSGFSAAPSCVVSPEQPGTEVFAFIAGDTALSSTNVHVGISGSNDYPFTLHCFGAP